MHRNLLTLKAKKIGAAERLMLYRLLDRFGPCGPPPQHHEILLKKLQFPEKRGRKVFRELVQPLQLLEKSAPATGRGRPLSRYRPSEELLELLHQPDAPHLSHQDRIAAILWKDLRCRAAPAKEAGKAPSTSGMAKELSPEDLWLLAVLLAHADDLGMITELSKTMLGNLTGLTPGRMARRLQKLERLDIAISVVPWASSRYLSGSMKPLIHLNLGHPDLGGRQRPAVQINFSPLRGGRFEHWIESLALAPFSLTRLAEFWRRMEEYPSIGSLPTKARRAADDGLSIESAIAEVKGDNAWENGLEAYFQDFARPAVLTWFQARVTWYAATVLEGLWGSDAADSSAESSASVDARVLALIQCDFPKTKSSNCDLDRLYCYILTLAQTLATHMNGLVEEHINNHPGLAEILDQKPIRITVDRKWSARRNHPLVIAVSFWVDGETSTEVWRSPPVLLTGGEGHPPGQAWLRKPLPLPPVPGGSAALPSDEK